MVVALFLLLRVSCSPCCHVALAVSSPVPLSPSEPPQPSFAPEQDADRVHCWAGATGS